MIDREQRPNTPSWLRLLLTWMVLPAEIRLITLFPMLNINEEITVFPDGDMAINAKF